MAPTINVNLAPCVSWCQRRHAEATATHDTMCPAWPILLPCPVPRSVTFQMVLGECMAAFRPGECLSRSRAEALGITGKHHPACPAHSVKVACSIVGATWEESDVEHCGPHTTISTELMYEGTWTTDDAEQYATTTCRDRWALVKALVLGERHDSGYGPPLPFEWCERRDAVFAELADMARAEVAAERAQQRCDEVFPYPRYRQQTDTDHRQEKPSRGRLAAYVRYLLEQAEVLS